MPRKTKRNNHFQAEKKNYEIKLTMISPAVARRRLSSAFAVSDESLLPRATLTAQKIDHKMFGISKINDLPVKLPGHGALKRHDDAEKKKQDRDMSG